MVVEETGEFGWSQVCSFPGSGRIGKHTSRHHGAAKSKSRTSKNTESRLCFLSPTTSKDRMSLIGTWLWGTSQLDDAVGAVQPGIQYS